MQLEQHYLECGSGEILGEQGRLQISIPLTT